MKPSVRSTIAYNAVAVRDGRPTRPVRLSNNPWAIFMRARRFVARRRAAYDGVRYHDRMASDPIVCAEAWRSLPDEIREALETRYPKLLRRYGR